MKIELYNDNCLDIIPTLNCKVDAIICDLPYGTTNCTWDSIIPFEQMWNTLKLVTNKNTPIILFGQEPFSSLLRCSNLKDYKYDIYWEKERITNIMQVKKRVGKNIETISIFYKNFKCPI
jgi:site-specific DNA-methyltransferase (adenine-specific)